MSTASANFVLISSLTPLLFPPTTAPELEKALSENPSPEECPFPAGPHDAPLTDLLEQSRLHLTSPDFLLVLPRCIDTLYRSLLDELASQTYMGDEASRGRDFAQAGAQIRQITSKRVVECLPSFTKWSKRVWEGIPDEAVDVSAISAGVIVAEGLTCSLPFLDSDCWGWARWRLLLPWCTAISVQLHLRRACGSRDLS